MSCYQNAGQKHDIQVKRANRFFKYGAVQILGIGSDKSKFDSG
jgi:hypothetical protein